MPKKILVWLWLAGLSGWLSSCVVTKPLDTPVRVSIRETVPVIITKDAEATFINNYIEEDYRKAFVNELKRTLAFNNLVIDPDNPQFDIIIDEFSLNETTAIDTVKDEKSKDHGKTFPIAEGSLRTAGSILNLATQQTTPWSADHKKRERLTSFQSPDQMIKGENKDLTEYRKKNFDRNEFVTLSGKCGQNTADAITKLIRKQIQ